jgi:hypothetical protein
VKVTGSKNAYAAESEAEVPKNLSKIETLKSEKEKTV